MKALFSLNPGSFFEDASLKELRYLPNLPCEFHVDVAWEKKSSRWRACKDVGDLGRWTAPGTGTLMRTPSQRPFLGHVISVTNYSVPNLLFALLMA